MTITQHFSAQEFACHNGDVYPVEWYADRLVPLCTALEAIRAELGGRRVTILSGYRSPAYNAARARKSKGVATDSQHIHGRAADITVEGVAPSDVHAAVLKLDAAKAIKIGGLGIYSEWVHVDVRERAAAGHLAEWIGT